MSRHNSILKVEILSRYMITLSRQRTRQMAEKLCQDILISIATKKKRGITEHSLKQCHDIEIVCRYIIQSKRKKVCCDIENLVAIEADKS